MTSPGIWASLAVESTDIDPDEITRRVGLAPTEAVRIGERSRPGHPPMRWHRWELKLGDTSVTSCVDEDVLVPRLRELGEPVAAALAGLRLAGAEVTLSLLQHVDPDDSDSHGIVLPHALIAWLARAGATVSVDQYMADGERSVEPIAQ